MPSEPKNTADTIAENSAVAYFAERPDWVDATTFDGLFRSLKRRGFGACAERLAYLHSPEDMEDDEAPLSLESVRGFVNFINDFSDLGDRPMLGLAPSGDLSVEWRIADDKHLGIWPLDGGHVAFAFIGPSDKPGERARLSGKGTIAEIIHTLREHGVGKWGDFCSACR